MCYHRLRHRCSPHRHRSHATNSWCETTYYTCDVVSSRTCSAVWSSCLVADQCAVLSRLLPNALRCGVNLSPLYLVSSHPAYHETPCTCDVVSRLVSSFHVQHGVVYCLMHIRYGVVTLVFHKTPHYIALNTPSSCFLGQRMEGGWNGG